MPSELLTDHPGTDRLIRDIASAASGSATPPPTSPTILTPRYQPEPVATAEDVIDPSRATPAPWRGRCYIPRRKVGYDVISPSGKYWLSMDGRVWVPVWDTMTLGAFQSEQTARTALSVAPRPDDATGPVFAEYVARPKDYGACARQETAVRQARENNRTEAAADKAHGVDREAEARAYRAAIIKAQRSAGESMVRQLIDHLRTDVRNARPVADAERWLRNLPPSCPSCGEYMTREPASPADPDAGIMQPTPAHWTCCGVAINDTTGPIAPEDDRDPAKDENVTPDPFDPR